jgi:hypothetical protein
VFDQKNLAFFQIGTTFDGRRLCKFRLVHIFQLMPIKKHGPIIIFIAFNHQKLCHLEKSQEKFGQTLDPKTDE